MSFLAVGGTNYVYDSADDIVEFSPQQLDRIGNRRQFMGSTDEINRVKMMQLSKLGIRQSQHLLNLQKHDRIYKGKRDWAALPTVMTAIGKFKKAKGRVGPLSKSMSDPRSMLQRGVRPHSVAKSLEPPPAVTTNKRGWDKLRNISAYTLHRAATGTGEKEETSTASDIVRHVISASRNRRVSNSPRKRGGSVQHSKVKREGRRCSTAVVEEEKKIKRWDNDGEAKAYFRRAARKVLIILSWSAILKNYNDHMGDQLKSFMDMAREIKETTAMKKIEEKTGLAFDPSEFKADKEIQLSSECVSILTLPAFARTADMITKVIANLKSLRSFQEYPAHMQEKLAKVAWYQILEPRRLILREGHYAENFYFILSGEAVVKKILRNPKTGVMQMTALAVLQKGKSFGEIALLHHSRRTASIETGTTTKMLVVSRGDFLSIFMNMKDGEEPDHVKFLRTCSFVKDFPISKLMLFPGVCLFHYFGRSTTVVADSSDNQWLYIVKTGSCSVIKKLNAVAPQKCWGSKRREDSDLSTVWSEPATPKVDSWHKTRAKSAADVPDFSKSKNSNFFATQREQHSTAAKGDDKENEVDARRTATYTSQSGSDDNVLPLLALGNKANNNSLQTNSKTQKHPFGDARDPNAVNGFSKSRGVTFLPTLADPNMTQQRKPLPEERKRPVTVPPVMPRQLKRASVFKPTTKLPDKPQSNGSCFVQLRSLKPGDVFGLEDVEFEDEPFECARTSVTLASNGAELIMMSKKIFMKFANEHVQRYVREHRRLFPAEDMLQENLQREMNWRLFREATTDAVFDLANDLHRRASLA